MKKNQIKINGYYVLDKNGNPIVCDAAEATHVEIDPMVCIDTFSASAIRSMKANIYFARQACYKTNNDIDNKNNLLKKLNDEISKLNKEREPILEEIERYKNNINEITRQNSTLIRMAREATNKMRGLKPKDCGYLVIKGEDGVAYNKEHIPMDAWITTIETPLPSEIERESVIQIIKNEWSVWCPAEDQNPVYDIKLRCERGLWYIRIYTDHQPTLLNIPWKKY